MHFKFLSSYFKSSGRERTGAEMEWQRPGICLIKLHILEKLFRPTK